MNCNFSFEGYTASIFENQIKLNKILHKLFQKTMIIKVWHEGGQTDGRTDGRKDRQTDRRREGH